MADIIRITPDNYRAFEAMVQWRMTGQRQPIDQTLNHHGGNKDNDPKLEQVCKELTRDTFHVFAVEVDQVMVGWIQMHYMAKIGPRWPSGVIYVDELWVHPDYRRQGLAQALMETCDQMRDHHGASQCRLNVTNPHAKALYEKVGYRAQEEMGFFMVKE